MPRLADHPDGIAPLIRRGRLVVVDARPICSACGRPVIPTGPDSWRHVPRGRTSGGRSRWLPPMPLNRLIELDRYAGVVAHYPWVRDTASESEWKDARERARGYVAGLSAARRRRRLRAGENPCLDLFRILTSGTPSPGATALLDLSGRRRELASLFSWAIPTDAALDLVARTGLVVETGAGMGYWSALLRELGADVVASDPNPPGREGGVRNRYHRDPHRPWTTIERDSAISAVRRHPDRTLFLCWPPYDDDASSYDVLRTYRGDVLLYAGRLAAGSTRFHRELTLNWTVLAEIALPHWPNIPDSLVAYRRNPERRAHRLRDRCVECGRFIATGSAGRCDECFERRPPAIALRSGRHRLEYPQHLADRLPAAVRRAFEQSPNRIR